MDVLVWAPATTRSVLVGAFAQAAAELIGSDAPEDPEHAAAAFLAWLEPKAGRPACRWLVVLDDVADPADLTGLWPAASPTGQTLVTSRRRDPALLSGRHTVTLGVFTATEAHAYLMGAFAPGLLDVDLANPVRDLDALADDLGHLPLALSQAAAYIAELADAGMTTADYRRLLSDRTRMLRNAAPDRLPDGQALTVAATWSLSIEHADTLRPLGLARRMLCLLSFLDPNGIPETVLTNGPALVYLGLNREAPWRRHLQLELYPGFPARPGYPQPASPGTGYGYPSVPHKPEYLRSSYLGHRTTTGRDTPSTARQAVADVLDMAESQMEGTDRADAEMQARAVLSVLRRLSLIERSHDRAAGVRVHVMVQRAVHDTLPRDEYSRLARTAGDVLLAAWPDIERDTTLASELRANAMALAGHAGTALYLTHAHLVLHATGSSLGNAGQASAARDLFSHLTTVTTLHLGPNHPSTLAARSGLGRWRGEAGDPAGAVAVFTELLPDLTRVLGRSHPDTLAVRGRLVHWRTEAEGPESTYTAFSELLSDAASVWGLHHPDTLRLRSQTAHWRGEAGDPAGAQDMCDSLFPDVASRWGLRHPDTLRLRSQMAHWRGVAGDPAGAYTICNSLVPDLLRVWGPDHPDTLRLQCQRAYWRGKSGKPQAAHSTFAGLLPDLLRVWGPDHPDTFTARGNLAHWQGEAGDPEGAVAALSELAQETERVLGPNHPYTLNVRHLLTHWCREAGEKQSSDAE
ncbi:tetratricopeptide repeat protein [Kitasatospora sp. NPDC056446]|uniref:tetratricopeptide repeat protein n=1 Tax=Kitasatospora sp. NPDC056446 TaxID=3345819 RepID=UPI0036794E4A